MDEITSYLQECKFKTLKTTDTCIHYTRHDKDNILIILNKNLDFFHISCDTISKENIKDQLASLMNAYTNILVIITKMIEYIETGYIEEEEERGDEEKKEEFDIQLYLPKMTVEKTRELTIY